MGGCSSSDKVQPQDHDSKDEDGEHSQGEKSKESIFSSEYVTSAEQRSCTDLIFLILMILFLISLIGLIVYCAENGDIYRIVNGYDSCGNICGMVTKPDKTGKIACLGKDYTKHPYLLVKEPGRNIVNLHRECVENCSQYHGYRVLINRCVPAPTINSIESIFSKSGIRDFLQESSEDLQLCWREILYMCLLALLFSTIVLVLFRFVADVLIWLILVLGSLSCIAGTIFLWVRWSILKDRRKVTAEGVALEINEVDTRTLAAYLAFALLATIGTIVMLLIILVMRKRIQLVVQLFKEAGKASSDMPLLMLEPFVTFLFLTLICGLWFLGALWIESAGYLTKNNVENYEFEKDGAMKFARWYNLLALLWLTQFTLAGHQIIIAGAVAKWFFTRNKENMRYPIVTSSYVFVRFHMGTAAFGSFIISLIKFLRAIVATVDHETRASENGCSKCIFKTCHVCLYCFEKLLHYLSRHAYIVTAIHGKSFCSAGRKAFQLLTDNALRVLAINSVGDYVLLIAKVMVVVATCLCGIEMMKDNPSIQHLWVPIMLGGLFALYVAHAFISVYEMIIDTIFICFCEDCEQNDGLSRPYHMSRGLMEFVENSKKHLH